MIAAEVMVPCMSSVPTCRLDWAAVSAVGGWIAALITLIAVVVALSSSRAQSAAADKAVRAERSKAEYIQQREWDARTKADQRTAMQLAQAFAKELAYGRRELVATLIDWDPDLFTNTSHVILESFVAKQPFHDLVFLRSCTDRLQGFEDEDAFALLSVLTTWQFFNRDPGLSISEIQAKQEASRRDMAKARVTFGLQLLDSIEQTINRMARYYEGHPSIIATSDETLTDNARTRLADLRKRMAGKA
ncbi:hypothetical protein [Stenotrophomonas sp. PS02289]|uniref:hypothetical protein n=1 Tax=Stenotrophomonas sp. PS02289 TaxID=2991422 RepID=UPI00249B7DCA|nr:hypothetical protein [Stenotrophomonas sp. PS02289]